MDADRFDRLLRSLSQAPSRRGAVRLLAGSTLGGLFGLAQAKSTAKKGGGKGGKKKCTKKGKTTICHQGQTITVAKCALKAHQRHGDTIGACPTSAPACPADADTCANNTPSCGNSGGCLRPVGGGPSRCGTPVNSTCNVCTSDAICQSGPLGPDAFCARNTGPLCPCSTGENFCAVPA